ncbi:MAG TPA: dienelactone hydrolase family protein [Candidatus Binatia bacterium]|nr:dienelactone hydrolase family protein [Candidatus Binatia bacterium]
MELETQTIDVPAEGGSLPGCLARPKTADRSPAVLVIMEAFGLNAHIQDVTRRIAAEGYVAFAPDLYWRGGKGRTVRYDELPAAIALMQTLRDDQVVADLRSAIAYLERQPFVRADRIGITGFCMGGRISYLAAAELPDKIKATAPFYGGGIAVDRTPQVRAPVLAFFGEKDPYIPPETVEALRSALARRGKDGEVVVYPGADHGFFCNERGSYQEAAAKDAWTRLLDFFARHLKR